MSNLRKTLKAIRQAKKSLTQFAENLPDLDANSMAHSIVKYAIDELDLCINSLPLAMKEAKILSKKYPELAGKIR